MITIPITVRTKLEALSKKQSPKSPQLGMLVVMHNLLYIVDNLRHIEAGIIYYNENRERGYQPNPYFTSAKDWADGVMRDDWQVSFHVTEYQDNTGKVEAEKFFHEINYVILSLSDVYELVSTNGRLDEFCDAFDFDEKTACLQKRVMKVLQEDWSQPVRLMKLIEKFMAQFNPDTTESEILARYAEFWTPYENSIIENQCVTQEIVLQNLSTLYGHNFEQVALPHKPSVSTMQPFSSTNWSDIQKNPHYLTRSKQFYAFYFTNAITAHQVHNWLRNQESLRPLGIMRSSVQYDATSKKHSILISVEQYQSLESIYQVARKLNTAFRTSTVFSIGVNEASTELFSQALVIQLENGWSALHTAARYQGEAVFLSLVNKASTSAIDSSLALTEVHGWTLLQLAARNQSEAAFLALINKISSWAIDKALIIQNESGWSALHSAARYQIERSFLSLVNKASTSAIDRGLAAVTNISGWTPLHVAARNQSEVAFLGLVNKASASAIDSALEKAAENIAPGNVLHIAIVFQSAKAFCYLIDKASATKVDAAAKKYLPNIQFVGNLKNILGLALKYQSPLVVNQLISKLSTDTLGYLIQPDPELFSQLYLPCFLDATFDSLSEATISLLFETSREKFIAFCCAQAAKGKFIPEKVKRYVTQALANKAPESLSPPEQCLLNSGLISTSSKERAHNPRIERIKAAIDNNYAALKIIKPEHWANTLKQLHDQHFRPSLRKKVTGSYKVTLGTGEVVKYSKKLNTSITHTDTKKISLTLLAPSLLTAVFGEHCNTRLLVGLLFDLSLLRISALLAKDSSTYYKSWIANDYDSASIYRAEIQPYHFTSFEKFKERINQNPFIHNEILAKIPYDEVSNALMAIVIAKDSSEARTLARAQALEIERLFNVALPIIFYDRFAQEIHEYSQEVQIHDGLEEERSIQDSLEKMGYPEYSHEAAHHAKDTLLKLKIPVAYSNFVTFLFPFTNNHMIQIKKHIEKAQQKNTLSDWFMAKKEICTILKERTESWCVAALAQLEPPSNKRSDMDIRARISAP